jgi:hypothetical protein
MRIFRKVQRSEDLHATGRRGTARVLSTKLLNRGEFQVSAERAEEIMAGEATMTTVKLELEVSLDGETPYRVTQKVPVPMMAFTKVVEGSIVPVLVDPGDRKRLEIDWDGEIVEPTLEERAQHDPMLQSLLDRRVDPDTDADT